MTPADDRAAPSSPRERSIGTDGAYARAMAFSNAPGAPPYEVTVAEYAGSWKRPPELAAPRRSLWKRIRAALGWAS